jgi:hypothetical protein
MSFSYKTLNSTDLTLTSYIANKFWEVKNSTLAQNGVTIFVGENLPLNRNNPFDPIDDIETTNDEYRRLIFESIKHLYYESYTSGSESGQFYQSSSYFNYDQTTLTSGSMVSSFKKLPTLTGSANIKTDSYDESIRYDSPTSIYDQSVFDPNRGGKIVVIAVDKEVFGSGLNPNSVFISGSGYYLRDDGEGNLYNYLNESNYARYNSAIYNKDKYLEIVNSGALQLEYIGNVFYSHGIIVITNEDYLCAFGAPPSAVNDYFSYFNMDTPQILDPLGNDISDCGSINFDSFTAHPYPGKTFPDFTYENGFLSIIPNHKSVIPSRHQIGYSIENVNGLQSNTGSLNLEITSKPLRIKDIVSSSTCYGSTIAQPVTFSIDYGVPYYSYSLDYGSTYIPVDNLFNVRVSGSIIPSDNSMIYVKDYLGEIISSSLDLWYPPIIYTAINSRITCYGQSLGEITVTGNEGLTTSINNDVYYNIPHTFTGLASGSYMVYAKDIYNCVVSSSLNVTSQPKITLTDVTSVQPLCYGTSTGRIGITITNLPSTYTINWTNINTGATIPASTLTTGNSAITGILSIPTGSYKVVVTDTGNGCAPVSASINLTGPSKLYSYPTVVYANAGFTSIDFTPSGGTGPYVYVAENINNSSERYTLSSTTSNRINLTQSNLNAGTFRTYTIDSRECVSDITNVTVWGRAYIYSGSVCETF